MPSSPNEDACFLKVREWLNGLKHQRKYSSTSTVCKFVNHLPANEQESLISRTALEIKLMLQADGRDVQNIKPLCSVLNGCFDNFQLAALSVKRLGADLFIFVNQCLMRCMQHFRSTAENALSITKMDAMEIIHMLSRVSSLVLKARCKDEHKKFSEDEFRVFQEFSVHSSEIVCYAEGLPIDTKVNLASCLWRIREINSISLDAIDKMHSDFVAEIPSVLKDEEYNTNVVKFIMASAAINAWDGSVIHSQQIAVYMNFFLSLCESYSSDTPVLLMSSRTMQSLCRHGNFENYLATESNYSRLITCSLMILEHPVSCVRHSGRDLLQVLVTHRDVQPQIMTAIFGLSSDRKAFFQGLSILSNVLDTREIISKEPAVPCRVLAALDDPTAICHVAFAVECLSTHDSLVRSDPDQWCELWVIPLLSMQQRPSFVTAEIEKVVLSIFKHHPFAIDYVLEKWKNPTSDYELRGVLLCLKNRNKLKGDGASFLHSFELNNGEGHEGVMEKCLHHSDDEIRLSAFTLIAEGSLSTQKDCDWVLYFLKYNLNNFRPATRQRTISLFKKMLLRIDVCYNAVQKQAKNTTIEMKGQDYIEFLNSLIDFCYSQMFAGTNFNRLNTVMTILMLIKEVINSSFLQKTNFYDNKHWDKCVAALDSNYEENKIIAVALCKGISCDKDSATLRQDFREAFGLIQQLEPPSVLLGSYTLMVLLQFPLAEEVLSRNFADGISSPSKYSKILCLQVLARYLQLQINEAEESLITAVRQSPMYGTVFAIRLILKELDVEALSQAETKAVLQQLIHCCFKIGDVVASVVNNSSPEGHLPMDFQQLVDDKKIEDTVPEFFENETYKGSRDLQTMMAAYDKAVTPEDKLMLAEAIRSVIEEEVIMQTNHNRLCSPFDVNCESWRKCLQHTKTQFVKYDCFQKFFEGLLPRIQREKAVTAQALLLCSWRSMKESCLFLGDLVSKLPLKDAVESGLLDEKLILQIGEKLRILLSEIKHRGAFEQADVGFTALCLALWKCPLPQLQNLPFSWLQEVLSESVLPPGDQTVKFTSTRRSAGLPFLVQTIITTEISSGFSPSGRCLEYTLKFLFNVAEDSEAENSEARLHSLNIIRALFKHAQLGEFVAPFVSQALLVAIRGSRSPTWPERNCCNMLFSTLMIRIFGVARSRDHLSKKNKMTSSVFFQRFPELYNCFLSEMKMAGDTSGGVEPQPSLYLVLLLMGRLYPPSAEEAVDVTLRPFEEEMACNAANPIHRIRMLAARAIVPLIPCHRMTEELSSRFKILSDRRISNNHRHGLLLQILEMLKTYDENSQFEAPTNINECRWMFRLSFDCLKFPVSCAVLQVFTQALIFLWRHFPTLRENIADISNDVGDWSILLYYASKNELFVEPFLSALVLLQLEILTCGCLQDNLKSREILLQMVLRLKTCGVAVVENIILQFLYNVFTPKKCSDFDFSLTEDEVEELLCLSTNEKKEVLKGILLAEFHHYATCENIVMMNNAPLQQRRLRVVILGHMIHSRLQREDSRTNELFRIVHLYSDFWDPDVSLTVQHDFSGSFSFYDSVYCNIANTMNALLENDRECRYALACTFEVGWWTLVRTVETGPGYLRYWMIPFRLLVDEDEDVRMRAQLIVRRLASHVSSEITSGKSITLGAAVTALRAQEILLRCFISLNGEKNSYTSLVAMAVMTVIFNEESDSLEAMEIFKRGNPNPFCESIALTRLFVDATRNISNDSSLDQPFNSQISEDLYLDMAPIFARHGLKLKTFGSSRELLSELARLDPMERTSSDVFRGQINELLSLL